MQGFLVDDTVGFIVNINEDVVAGYDGHRTQGGLHRGALLSQQRIRIHKLNYYQTNKQIISLALKIPPLERVIRWTSIRMGYQSDISETCNITKI